MLSLLLSTLGMMGLTFLIGFFVAAIIKLIAVAADSLDFYSAHHIELARLHRWQRQRHRVERLVRQIPMDHNTSDDTREDYSKGIDRHCDGYHGYNHGVSRGFLKRTIIDCFYPEDRRMAFLEEQENAQKSADKKAAQTTDDKNTKH